MSRRTVCDFTADKEIWTVVEGWAKETRYRLRESDQSQRLYQKGRGILVVPTMLEVSQTKEKVHLEVWIRANLFFRLTALFLIPSERGIESGGFMWVAPRRVARRAVNKLLEKLG